MEINIQVGKTAKQAGILKKNPTSNKGNAHIQQNVNTPIKRM